MDSSGLLLLGNMPHNIQSNMNISMNASNLNLQKSDNNNDMIESDVNDGNDYWNDNDNQDQWNEPKMNHNDGKSGNTPGKMIFDIHSDKAMDGDFIKSNFSHLGRREGTNQQGMRTTTKKPPKTYGGRLDPHIETNDSKPVRKATCYRIPKILKVNSCKSRDDDIPNRTNGFERYIKDQLNRRKTTVKWSLDDWLAPNNVNTTLPLTGVLLPAFQHLHGRQRHERRIQKDTDIEEDLEDDYIYRDPVDDHEYGQQLMNRSILNPSSSSSSVRINHVHDSGGVDDGIIIEMNDDMQCFNNNIDIHVDTNEDDHGNDYGNCDDVDDEEVLLAKRVDKILNDELGSSLTSSYKMICDRMILDFKRGVEQYAKETHLSRRVTDWTNRIEPILQNQEKVPVYDIHEYSDRILLCVNKLVQQNIPPEKNTSNKSKDVVKFDNIVVNKSHTPAEVCRVFLACLQLANLGNLVVVPPEKNQGHEIQRKISKSGKVNACDDFVENPGRFHDSFYVRLLDSRKKVDIENHFPLGV